MTVLFSNNAQTTIAGSISAGSTSVALSPGTGAEFPNPSAGQVFLGTFNDAATGLLYEIVQVTARSTDTLTITRAQEGTAALSWSAGDIFGNFMTGGTAQSLQQAAYYAIDTGAADAYVATLSPAFGVTGYVDGLKVRVRIGAGNANLTTTPTLNVNGLGPIAITRLGGGAMAVGDLQAAAEHELTYSGSTSKFLCTTLPPWVSGEQEFTGTGTFTPTTGVTRVRCRVWGATGGSGAGQTGTGGGGGGPGGYAEGYFSVTPGVAITVTIGAAGAAGVVSTSNGTPGGTTSVAFASGTIQSTGGGGGQNASTGGAAGVGSGGTINKTGTAGGTGIANVGAAGGAVAFGATGGSTSQGVGTPGTFPAGAPGGSASSNNGTAGWSGYVVINW